MEALLSKQNSPFCSASRENPFLHPNSRRSLTSGGRRGSMPPSRAWRRLLLVCFMLCTWGGQAMKEHQTLCQGGCQCQPRQGPISADTSATSQQSSLPPTISSSSSFSPHSHSIGETPWFTPCHRPVLFFLRPRKKCQVTQKPRGWGRGRGRLGTRTISFTPQLPPVLAPSC